MSIIEVKNLGKRYNIGERQSYVALRDVLTNIAKSPARWFGNKIKTALSQEKSDEFWALKDVNFNVEQGEVLGIIGRNGAGKSTLLKILSQITPPTTGEIRIKGRVGSLLEVGTGFHPELTGRENIYLNGAILGMRKKEIEKKFDEIVEFSGVSKFLDMPVKRYSSGMYVRLAFSVAAHLEPDILVVDEVLSVGDAEFQKKCLGKMGEVTKKEGRTVLFVSHNMSAVQRLCSKCILLEGGKVVFSGETKKTINHYLSIFEEEKFSDWCNSGNIFNNPWFKPINVYLSDDSGHKIVEKISNDSDVWLNIEGYVEELDSSLNLGYVIYNEDNVPVYMSFYTDSPKESWPPFSLGRCVLRTKLPKGFFNEGVYKIMLDCGLVHKQYLFGPTILNTPSISFKINSSLRSSPYWTEKRDGVTAPIISWEVV